jgi:hypothetical protein
LLNHCNHSIFPEHRLPSRTYSRKLLALRT